MPVTHNFVNHSYWESKHYFKTWDLVVVGGGIVGVNAALSYKENHPRHAVLIVEQNPFGEGASTRNAGFACFGTVGELLDDLSTMSEESVWETVRMRWDGLQLLKKRAGEANLDFQNLGGHELFFDRNSFEQAQSAIDGFNSKIRDVIGIKDCFQSSTARWASRFPGLAGAITNRYEGQIDSGRMMLNFRMQAAKADILIAGGIRVNSIRDSDDLVAINTSHGEIQAKKVVVATNGLAAELLTVADVFPARAQVLVTNPVDLDGLEGTFHFDRGYYYFRNIDGRVLLGGGRNLDKEAENTSDPGLNPKIQEALENFLREKILPGKPFSIERRWTGIMGMGSLKKPIIDFVSPNVLAAVRMGGMGVAIGTLVGTRAANLLSART